MPVHDLGVQTWREFEQTASEDVPMLVNGLWPEGAQGMIGAAPKAGKTWVGLEMGVSVATGTPVFGSFTVPRARPVLYVALEGHRSALRARAGCIARGHGVPPEHDGLDALHFSYKPKGIDLADPGWAAALCDEARGINAGLVVVDVLRRAASFNENDPAAFMQLIDLLSPLSERGVGNALLHHFVKLSEISQQRQPGERMAGTGAMFGALDVGLFIVKSEGNARKLTIHTDVRDGAAPEQFIVTLQGDGTAAYGGFTYRDELRLVREDPDPDESLKKAKPREIRAWIIEQGGSATPGEIRRRFELNDQGLRERRERLKELGVTYFEAGKNSRYEATPLHPAAPRDAGNSGVVETHPATPLPYKGGSGDSGVTAGLYSRPGDKPNSGVSASSLVDALLENLDATELDADTWFANLIEHDGSLPYEDES